MKHKISELEGALLDAAVAKAEGVTPVLQDGNYVVFHFQVESASGPPDDLDERYKPSERWDHAGPIIERERIATTPANQPGAIQWGAVIWDARPEVRVMGPTALIAAMRAYVAGKFGEEVDLP